MAEEKSLQDIMSGDLFASSRGETVETLKFMEGHAVPYTPVQLAGLTFLEFLNRRRGDGIYSSIVRTVRAHAKDLAGPGVFLETIEKLTLADRIKGNVRLNRIFGDGGK